MALTDAVVAREDVDGDRTAAMGGSFGGYMANWVAGPTDRFRCVVTHASLWALDVFGRSARRRAPRSTGPARWTSRCSRRTRRTGSWARSSPRCSSSTATKDYRVPIGEGLRLWSDLLPKSGRRPPRTATNHRHRFLYFPAREPLNPRPAAREGLVRGRPRLPGRARPRRRRARRPRDAGTDAAVADGGLSRRARRRAS
ncbi:prolyl oligopeptidase family serine peptidase [Rhodococcus hoagii]|nr:prolyl oligopeptidase family serine peptidase [Prescottella equi]